jgi:tetratricopeptide (TPR) repeat protein
MMKKANLVLMAALAAAGLVGVTGGSLLPVTAVAADKDKDKDKAPKQKLSPDVAKPLMAAQTAIQAKNWPEAIAKVEEAQALPNKTPYDQYMTDELGWYAYVQNKDYPKAAEALERAMASGFVPDEDKPQRLRALTQLNLQDKVYPKAIQFGEQYLALKPDDQEIAIAIAQAHYLSGDVQGAKAAAEKLVSSSQKPSEPALLLALRTSYELKDDTSTLHALEGLVRHYPQPKYWEDLLNNALFRTKDDRALRALYRLMNDTSTLDKGEEYGEMGSTLVTGGFPTEAKQVLERGMAANVFQGDAKSRAQQDLDRAKSGATADAKEMATASQQLSNAKTGMQMVGIGKLYFSNGDYDKAVDALQKGLAKGGVTDTDDVNMLIGIADSRAGKTNEARTAFDAVKDPKLMDVARLWKIKLDTATASATPAPATETAPTAPAAPETTSG